MTLAVNFTPSKPIACTTLASLAVTFLALIAFALTAHAQNLPQPPQTATPSLAPSTDDQPDSSPPTIQSFTAEMERVDGFVPFYWDAAQAKVFLEVSDSLELLYAHGLATGLGSNPVGLDRGQWRQEHVVRCVRVGPKVYLQEPNLKYRAITDNPLEQAAVEQSFASSVLAAFEIKATDETGTLLIDATDFFLRDAHDVTGRLRGAGEGDYTLDLERSFLFREHMRGFPQNTEIEASLTFSGKSPGSQVQQTAPTPEAITLRQHHSLIQLPDDGYQPREFDPRVGMFKISFADYAADIGAPLWQHRITRHRLEKLHKDRDPSPPVEPIVYYVDPGTPPAIKQALIEGASWWNEAFEAAGYVDAFQVKELPADADPMDVRYNVIQWVHRATRGWSYGQSVIDPRTGEIIKGHVLLGSLRVHQDHLLFQGLQSETLDAAQTASASQRHCQCCQIGAPATANAITSLLDDQTATQVALARIRQLSAHEVGHTLGLAHNFAASTYADRASVMDYPAPRVAIKNLNQLDLSDAYAVGIGVWDKFVIDYAYRDFADADAKPLLAERINQAITDNMIYISDADARPASAAHPLANLWDNGSDPVAQLKHVMRVRKIAMARFTDFQLPAGQPRSQLQNLFVPVYLHHRYQVEAAAKMIGGATYAYAISGDSLPDLSPVPADQQRQALNALLDTLTPEALAIPENVTRRFLPRPYASPTDVERFPIRTDPIFDPLAAAEVAASMTIDQILQPQRLGRLRITDSPEWNLHTVVETTIQHSFAPAPQAEPETTIYRMVQTLLVNRLITLAQNENAAAEVRQAAGFALHDIRKRLGDHQSDTDAAQAHRIELLRRIDNYLNRDFPSDHPESPLTTPPGSPIGNSR